jgi:AraC-like DNA-binding protein
MFQPLLGDSMARLTDRVVPLDDVLASTAWTRAIDAEPDVDAKIAIAESALAALLAPLESSLVRMRDLVERMASDRSIQRVEDVCDISRRDARALQREFRRYVGVSPKWVLQRFRLHEAAAQLARVEAPPLAALSASLGYADQAHFCRDFKREVGATPRGFAATRGTK